MTTRPATHEWGESRVREAGSGGDVSVSPSRSLVPPWLDRSELRRPNSLNHLNKLMRIDGITVGGWLGRRERLGRPVKRRYQNAWCALDIIAAAHADAVPVDPNPEVAAMMTLEQIVGQVARLRVTVAELEQERSALTVGIETDLAGHQLCRSLDALAGRAHRLATRSEIAAAASPATICCGVYFLLQDGLIVYVGQSVNVFARMQQHQVEKRGQFNQIAWLEVARSDLDLVESLYIHALAPPLNGPAPIRLDVLLRMASAGAAAQKQQPKAGQA